MLGRQFTGDSFKVSDGGGEGTLSNSQIVGITNKKSYGEKKFTNGDKEGESVTKSQSGVVWHLNIKNIDKVSGHVLGKAAKYKKKNV